MYIQKLIVGSPIMYTVHSFLHMLILFPPPWIYTTKWTAKMYPGRPEYSDILEENWFDSTFFGIPFLLQLPTSPHTHWLYIIWLFKHLMKTFLFFSKHTVRAPDYFALLYATAVKKKKTLLEWIARCVMSENVTLIGYHVKRKYILYIST
jgi:hypothetical protein